MPLATVLGYGPPELTSIGLPARKVDLVNVALVGIRSLDEGERSG